MGQELRLVVVAEEALGEVAAVPLVDDPTMGVARDVDRRGCDQPVEPGGRKRLEHTMGGADIRVVHRRPLAGRDADPIHAGQMDGGVGATHGVHDRCGPGQVTPPDIDTKVGQGLGPLGIPDGGRHRVATRSESTDDHLADETGPAGDEDAHQGTDRRCPDPGPAISRSGSRDRRPRATT